MKKHYIKLTVVITVLILAAFLLAGGFYTYVIATKTMNESMKNVKRAMNWSLPDNLNHDTDHVSVIRKTYRCWVEEFWHNHNDIGFYGMLDLGEGKILEPKDYLSVYAENEDENDRNRIIIVGDDFQIPRGNMFPRSLLVYSLDGMCDDSFIFEGTVTYRDYSDDTQYEYHFGKNDLASASDAVPVSAWKGGNDIDITYFQLAATRSEAKLNAEAKELLHTYFAERETPSLQQKLGTSYYISGKRFDAASSNLYAVYVFHPLKMAVKTHIFIYILAAVLFVVLEALAIFTMKKLYSNRMCYELMRQDLTRSIAHDLKTPLAVTKAYTENWEYIDEADRHEYAEKLNAEVDHMASLIGNMLSMSKLDSEKELKLEEVELSAMTSAVFEQMQPIIQERGISAKLVTDIIGGKYYVNADPKMMRIVISNFITNAIKYAEKKVEIKLSGSEKLVRFQVSNDGPGISKKDIKKIWEPFYKTDKARTDRLGSSGMGLAINRSILTLHKAKYDCSSDENETRFWFEIKRVQENG